MAVAGVTLTSDVTVLRSRLDRLYRKAVAASATLLATLQAYHDKQDELVEGNSFLIETAAGAHSAKRLLPSGIHLHDALRVARELLDLFTVCRSSLVEDAITSPTDLQIYTEMMFRLQPCKQATTDFGLVRDEPEQRIILTS